ncbi:nicastrin isoform X2 [Girardinichthys multiradiatus]|uniref:nicastrin isoform X2 n=1 Tax=Girardinichthys multiradiatus TaxID=208333 RepID=UPI001FAD58CE|nr:nicastrin isoform X2 [Girardinichthys multiradiatus]
MDFLTNKWIVYLALCLFFTGVCCNSVENKIYIKLNYTMPCVRLLNATHQIGCQSSLSGDVGVLHVLESEENLDWVLRTGLHPPYMVILESPLFTRSIMMKLKNGSSRVAGVAVVAPTVNPPQGFSPHTSCPNENSGVYSENYGPGLAHCNTTVWNPLGNGLSYEEFDFPIFSLKDNNDTQLIRQCYVDHNRPVNGSDPQYPLCAMQLFSHMSAVTNTATCMRRNSIIFSISPGVCDPLSDHNIWAPAKPLNTTEKGHKVGERVVLATARLDSRSFFSDIGPGAESAASGLVTLLAAAHALRNATQEAQLDRTIFYTFFHGETFDYIGSSRIVYDMEKNQFPIDLDNVHSVLEIGQVGLHSSSALWLHTDPVSRRNSSTDEEVKNLINNLQTAAAGLNLSVEEPGVTQPLPPSSFQRFLRARPFPGVVIEDHNSSFTNKYYQSMFDNTDNLNMLYPPNLTPEEQLNHVTDTAKSLAGVATMVARALFVQAGGEASQTSSIKADELMVSRMLYSFLVSSNNSWLQDFVATEALSHLSNNTANFYISVEQQISLPTFLVQSLLANLTGSTVNVTQEDCRNQRENKDDKDSKHLYSYFWAQGAAPSNSTEREGFCVRSTVRWSKAISPAFELNDYTSSNYSTWTESRWKEIKGRIFLVASHDLEMLTLGVGIGVLLTSLLLTYIMSSKADILFSSGREPTTATY